MIGMNCVNVGYRNENLINAADRLVNQIREMPAKYMSGELSSATTAMEEAVESKSSSRVVAHSKRLLTAVDGQPRQYISNGAVDAAAALKRLVQSYI